MLVPHFAGATNQITDEIVNVDSFSNLSFRLSYALEVKKSKMIIEWFAGVKNIFNAYQDYFDIGKNRDSNFIYGPAQPRTLFGGIKIRSGKL